MGSVGPSHTYKTQVGRFCRWTSLRTCGANDGLLNQAGRTENISGGQSISGYGIES